MLTAALPQSPYQCAVRLQLDNAPASVNILFALQSAKARLHFVLMKTNARMRIFLWQGKHNAPGLPDIFASEGVFPYFPVVESSGDFFYLFTT